MGVTMKLLFLTAPVFLLLSGGAALAQTSAGGVSSACSAVAASGQSTGQCVAAAASFAGGNPSDDAVASLVDRLAEIAAADPACTPADDEIARAVRVLAAASPTAAARILRIAEAIDCDVASVGGGTSSSLVSPGSVGVTGGGGGPVSSPI